MGFCSRISLTLRWGRVLGDFKGFSPFPLLILLGVEYLVRIGIILDGRDSIEVESLWGHDLVLGRP